MSVGYHEGTWFAIPLPERGYAVGVVARCTPKGGLFLAYLFGPTRKSIPTLGEIGSLRPENAVKIWHIGDSHLTNGKWPVLGASESWKREFWPSPRFIRKDPLSKTAWLVAYCDSDTNKVTDEERVSFATEGFDRNSVRGAILVEKTLGRFLM